MDTGLIYDLALPFLFAFAISYYFISFIFSKRVSLVLSSAIGVFFVSNQKATSLIRQLFGEYAIYATAFLLAVALLKFSGLGWLLESPLAPIMSLLTGKPLEETRKKKQVWLTVVVILAVAGIALLNISNLDLPRIDSSILISLALGFIFLYLMGIAIGKKRGNENAGVPGSGAGEVGEGEGS